MHVENRSGIHHPRTAAMLKRGKDDPEESHRMLASISFVGVLIIIGLPLWWKTTEVYRVALPYDRISALQELAVSVPARVTVLANDEPTASEVGGLLQELFKDEEIIKLSVEVQVLPEELRKSLTAAADETGAALLATRAYDANTPNHMYVVQWNRLYGSAWLSDERVLLFKDSTSTKTLSDMLKRWVFQTESLKGALAARSGGDAGRRVRLPPDSHYDITLSVAHPTPDTLTLEFPAQEAIEDYIGTFVDELSFLHNFTLKSQWLHLLELDFQATKVGDHWGVSEERLPHLLTPLEKRTATHVSRHSAVNLVLYVVPCEHAPLYVYKENGELVSSAVGFMSARWGGVVPVNPDEESCQPDGRRPFAPDVRLVMGTFLAQLRCLLGFNKLSAIDEAMVSPLRSVLPRKWEVDAVTTIRTLEQLTSAKLTLQSIAQLLGTISNIVINDEVGGWIHSSVEEVEEVMRSTGADVRDAYARSQRAFLAAESAFTSPSLLALLYFPDDQKYAVYIPLFLPVMIPVLFSLNNIFNWLRGKPKKEKAD